MNVRYAFESPLEEDVAALVFHLDDFLNGLYQPKDRHILTVEQLAEPGVRFCVARVDGVAVACGGIVPRAEYYEVKRMWVEPAARGLGMARGILAELEREAAALGAHALRLETGTLNHEANALYESAGFRRIAPFGEYVGGEMSVCFEKHLEESVQP